jgi:hypothetical protein
MCTTWNLGASLSGGTTEKCHIYTLPYCISHYTTPQYMPATLHYITLRATHPYMLHYVYYVYYITCHTTPHHVHWG